jgi:hypothetical protein
MAGTWSLRVGPDLHEGLTLFRLEALVRAGTLEGHHLVRSTEAWTRVEDVPYLRRQLPTKPTRTKDASAALPVGASAGRITPDVAMAMAMLEGESDRPRMNRIRALGRILTVFAVLLLVAEAAILARTFMHAG